MLIHAWNIQAGGGTRLARVLDQIAAHRADTVVLGETTRTRFAALLEGLERLGFSSIHGREPRGSERGVLIASKQDMEPTPPDSPLESGARWVEVWFPKQQFALAGVYAPDTPKEIARYWPRLLAAVEARREAQCLLVGDLNAGNAYFDSEYGVLHGDPWFTAMPLHGMSDLWRHKNKDRREYTWFSVNRGVRRGLRLDHAFGTASIRRRVRQVRYSHVEREEKVSDHSSLLVSVH